MSAYEEHSVSISDSVQFLNPLIFLFIFHHGISVFGIISYESIYMQWIVLYLQEKESSELRKENDKKDKQLRLVTSMNEKKDAAARNSESTNL